MTFVEKIKKIIVDPKKYWKNSKTIMNYFGNFIKKVLFINNIQEWQKNRNQIKFYKKYIIKTNKLIFDIGANVGKKTDLFLRLEYVVIVVEPQSLIVAGLRKKYQDNPRVIVEECGIGKEEGEAQINISTKYPGFSSFIKEWQKGTKYHSFEKTEKVKLTTLDKLISKYGLPDFCKIDVEDFEHEVLLGLSSKIPMINFEFHSNNKEQLLWCLSRLQTIGYDSFNFVVDENSIMSSDIWLTIDELLTKIETLEKNSKIVILGDVYAK
ncbi:MAG: FkbM family methyltransferase [Candidatus Zambryskibacteria bacterium]|nr:FkbM family methyltransferase [Candidatus Zambryskibacteria bacterium]